MKMKLGYWLAAMNLIVAAAASAQSSPTPLSGDQLKELVSGQTLSGDTPDGPYVIYFPVYGEMRGSRSSNYKDNGAWRVTADMACGKWDNWWGNKERCWHVYRDGSKLQWMGPDGETVENLTLVEGNPYNL